MISILQISDLHILPESHDTLIGVNTEFYFNAVLDLALLNHQYFDLILVTGDLAQDPCLQSYQRILVRLLQTNTACICLPGNHDDFQLMQAVFNTSAVSCQKQLFLKNWQIISLNSQIIDSSAGYVEKTELDFLESCLKAYPNLPTLIAVHHNCLPTHTVWLDTMIIKNARELLDLVKHYPQVKGITTGHIHQEMDVDTDSIRILGTPSTCFQFMPLSPVFSIDSKMPGYRVIKAYQDGKIETQVTRLEGALHGLESNPVEY